MTNLPQNEVIRILLVDDDEDDIILTKDLLSDMEQFDYHLDFVTRYEEALEEILTNTHDIYLIDYRLGQRDGIKLIREVVALNNTIPIILLTGKSDKSIDMQAMREGASDFLVKGEITPPLLERSIRYAIKNAEALKKVKENENKFRQLFERSIDSIFVTSPEHVFEDVNPALLNLLQFPYQDLVGTNMSRLFKNKEDFDLFKHHLKENKGQIKEFETELVSKNDNALSCLLASVLLTDAHGKAIGYQGIIHDITMRKRAEKQLLTAERLTVTGKLARSIAHEIRNPLTNLGLAVDQLQDEVNVEDEDVKIYFDIIKRNSHRIDQLINEMLNSSRPRELNRAAFPINDLAKNSLDLVKDRLILKGMKIKTEFQPDIPPVFIDQEKMKVALVNILVNAIEAMEEKKGKLVLSTSVSGDFARLSIQDNGSGISEDDLTKLFDPFYTRKQGGMGLGLTSTHNIIHGHEGTIEVESKLHEGTNFLISLPLFHANDTNLSA